eukprot:Opistho-2@31453
MKRAQNVLSTKESDGRYTRDQARVDMVLGLFGICRMPEKLDFQVKTSKLPQESKGIDALLQQDCIFNKETLDELAKVEFPKSITPPGYLHVLSAVAGMRQLYFKKPEEGGRKEANYHGRLVSVVIGALLRALGTADSDTCNLLYEIEYDVSRIRGRKSQNRYSDVVIGDVPWFFCEIAKGVEADGGHKDRWRLYAGGANLLCEQERP